MMPENLERMFRAAKEYDADVLHNNQVRIMLPLDDGSMPLEMLNYPENFVPYLFDRGEMIKDIQLLPMDMKQRLASWEEDHIHWFMGNKMIRRSFLVENEIIFPEVKLAEDAMFCLQCLLKAKNYVLMPGGWCLFRINPTSLTRSGRTVNSMIKALQTQLDVMKALDTLSEKLPALKDSENFYTAAKTILRSIENFSVRFHFQELGQEAIRADKDLAAFFQKNFGANAPYVEFLFFQLHEVYPKLQMLYILDFELLKSVKQAFDEAKASGKEFILKDNY